MSNPYYNPTGNPIAQTRALSSTVRNEFDAIALGFDAVDAAKANLASPAFTGTPTAPTASVGSTGSQLATLDFVNGVALGGVTNLPGQAGNAGKVLTTDGSNPSWAAVDLTTTCPVYEAFTASGTFSNGAPTAPPSVYNVSSDYEFLLFNNGHCALYTKSTKTLSSIYQYRSSVPTFAVAMVSQSGGSIVVASCNATTGFEAVGIQVSGGALFVGTPQTATLGGNMVAMSMPARIGASSFVIGYVRSTNAKYLRAITVSVNAATLGAETAALTGASTSAPVIEAHSTTMAMVFHTDGSNLYGAPYSLSGTTLTVGTVATVALAATSAYKLGGKLGSGRYFYAPGGTTGVVLFSVSGTTASAVSSLFGMPAADSTAVAVAVSSTEVLYHVAGKVTLLTDNAGTINYSAIRTLSGNYLPTSTGFLVFAPNGRYVVGAAASNPTFSFTKYTCGGYQGSPAQLTFTNDGSVSTAGLMYDGTKVFSLGRSGNYGLTYYFDGTNDKLVAQQDVDVTATGTGGSPSGQYGNGYAAVWSVPFTTPGSTTASTLYRLEFA